MKGQRIAIQERDLDLLHSLAEARLLTAECLEWLHFASWRARYRSWVERAATAAQPYQPSSNLYRRLRGLCERQLIRRVTRAIDVGQEQFYRLPDAFALTPTGAELVAARRDVERSAQPRVLPKRRAIQNLEHTLAIGRLYAALRAERSYRGRDLIGWQGDHTLARGNYDRIPVAHTRELLPILPDATFTLDGERLFVELDRGTRPLRSWAGKLRAYAAYQGSRQLQARYATERFRVLIIAPTAVRLARIAEAIAQNDALHQDAYLLILAEHIHPTSIRRGWQRIAGVEWHQRRVVDRLVPMPTVTLAPQALWENEA